MPGHKIPNHNEQDGEKKDDVTLDVNFNNVSLCRLGFRDELIRIRNTYLQPLKLYDGVVASEKEKTTFTIKEIGNQFNLLEKLEKIISAPRNADKNKDLRIIKEYKVILLTVLYDRIRNPNLDSGIPLPPIELPWYEKIWPGIKSAFNTLLKYLQFLALGLTKLAALFLPILALTEGIPFIASFFSIQIAVTTSPILLATLTASAATISLVSVYYYLPYLLQWLGITSPANQDKSLTQIAQEKCTIMGKINNRLEQTLLNLNSSQYKALANIIKPINEQITHLKIKNNLTPHKQSLKIKIVRLALFIFNLVASAHSAIGIASLFSVATLLASVFGSASAAASFTALLPVLIPISSVVLFVGFFSWAQFLVSTTVLNALDPVGASHALLTKSLTDFHPPSPETLQEICDKKMDEERMPLTQESLIRSLSPVAEKKRIIHANMYNLLKDSSGNNQSSNDEKIIDTTSIKSLWNKVLKSAPVATEKKLLSNEEYTQLKMNQHEKGVKPANDSSATSKKSNPKTSGLKNQPH